MIIFTSQVGKMPLNLGKQLLRGKTNMIFASEKCPHATGPKYAVSTLKHRGLRLIHKLNHRSQHRGLRLIHKLNHIS